MNPQDIHIIIKTLGCKLNFSESAAIEQKLTAKGYCVAHDQEFGDIFIINTCAVTSMAEKKCKQMLNHIKANNSHAKIALVGCFGALEQAKFCQHVDVIFGNKNKMQVVDWVENIIQNEAVAFEPENDNPFFSSYSIHERTRSFLKIQDGCNYHCSYCTVCIARGESRSDSIENVLDNAKDIVKHDIKEIVLTGVNVGDFHTAKNEYFVDLLKQLIKTEGLQRIRISSIEPNLLTDEIIQLCANEGKIVPHFHIPLQSGNNRILKLMRRRYQRELFAQKVEYIKSHIPHACIAADVIVGFPGETDTDFEDTYQFIQQCDINMLHVFPFSARPNTPAAEMDNQISSQTKKQRSLQLIQLSEQKKRAFYIENQGKTYPVLFEHKQDKGFIFGFTPNYIKVKTKYNENLINQIVDVKLEELDKQCIFHIKNI
ncbi:MAG: tRNA (N(6)-L-threonylcarbamoyladenosine(37)-C(2))-methylthiotransferase MtaB [Bacteroidales bacterium]|nr:tRNA (N(6)-L-threonylcarbamoyladenosine(37)-C(2))-methylthiotransferase MtaB [Bacteroidales bacterium]